MDIYKVSTLRVIARCVTANISGVDWVRIAWTEIINTNLLRSVLNGLDEEETGTEESPDNGNNNNDNG
jgi:hypothetical protein